MRVLGIVQARMGSSRLPGKVLRDLGGRSVLGRVVGAARESGAVDGIVVATTTDPVDDAVVAECEAIGVDWHRGPVDDVLTRFRQVIDDRPCQAVMRFTADCPLLDPEIIALVARVFAAVPGIDYVSTSIARTLPRGLDVEIVRADTLRTADRLARAHHRTHVTSFVYTNPDMFRVLGVTLQPDLSQLRLTLDTEDDWRLLQAVVGQFGDSTVSLRKVAEWLAGQPAVRSVNAHVRQKALEQA